MMFLKQIRYEIRNILKSRFILVIAILVMAGSVLLPVANVIFPALFNRGGGIVRPLIDKPYYASGVIFADGKGGSEGQNSITVEGKIITDASPFYWNLLSLVQQKDQIKIDPAMYNITTPEGADMAQQWLDVLIHFYVQCTDYISKPEDYRMELTWRGQDVLCDKFIFDNIDKDPDVLLEAVRMQKGLDPETFRKQYVDLTAEEKLAAAEKAEDTYKMLENVIQNDDFAQFIALRMQQENDQIAAIQANIDEQVKLASEHPDQAEVIEQTIANLKQQIKYSTDINIPILELRLAKDIRPGADIWQNTAISDIEMNRNQLVYTVLLEEEDFQKDQNLIQQYKTYRNYRDKVQKQINTLTDNINVAQNSINAEKPDMKYVREGSRNKTVEFLDYSIIVAIFGVLLGGWIIASEYQQGTIRLLMIRPRSRIKILASKFIAAFVICLAMFLACGLINMVTNGICYGFTDFGFPNYTITGEVSFLSFYLPKLLACILPILFAFAFAFMLSATVKNSAVSIAVPIVLYVCCLIGMNYFAYRPEMEWLAYTPVPYVQLSSFFILNSPVQNAIQNGISFSLPLGIAMLVVLSAVCMAVSVIVFKKRDITN